MSQLFHKRLARFCIFIFAIAVFNATANPQRIVALSPHSVEMLFALGLGDRIVATLDTSDYPQAAKKIPRVGNFAGVKIEKILALKPDLIVAWKGGNKASDLEKLESLGLNLFYSQPKNIQAVISEMRALAEIAGIKQKGEQIAEQLNNQYQRLKSHYEKRDKVRVFYQLWHKPLRSIGGNNWIDSMINDCGAENIFQSSKAPYPVVSFESVLTRNPAVIIIPDTSEALAEKKRLWDNWPEIAAVKKQQIYAVNGDLLHRFTPRAIEGLQQLCQAIEQAREK